MRRHPPASALYLSVRPFFSETLIGANRVSMRILRQNNRIRSVHDNALLGVE